MSLTLTLPDGPVLERLGPERLRLELACALYARREVGAVNGAEIAGVDFFTFQAALRERDIPGHYGAEELERDIQNLPPLPAEAPLGQAALDDVDEADEAEWERQFNDPATMANFARWADESLAREQPRPIDPARL